MGGVGEGGGGGVYCRAKKQLPSITSAPTGVISKQTDWNQPTEVSPRGSEGWTQEVCGGREGKEGREGVHMVKQQEDEMRGK